jgi:putative addiction module killer protein
MIEVRIYVRSDGSCPFTDWLESLRDAQARARIKIRLARLAAGNLGDFKGVTGSPLSELRIDYGPGYRVYLARRGAVLMVLLCGGDKRTQDADIKRAKAYLEDWEQRGEP